jgi:hypothetical protein
LSGNKAPGSFEPIDYEIYQIAFPKDSVAMGDEWTNEKPMPLIGGKRISTYYIESIYNSVIQIKVDGTLETSQGKSEDFSGR